MKYEQRDVVEVNFMFPDGSFKPHPALIISNNELQENEGYIYLCMISSAASDIVITNNIFRFLVHIK